MSVKDEKKVKAGKARAKALSPEKRKEIAKKAAESRWSSEYPKANYEGEIHIGDFSIPCAVLEDGTRLLTQEGFLKAIGRSGKPAAGRGSQVEKVAPFLDLINLKPFVNKELESSTYPLIFRPVTGSRAFGYRAELLPKVCEVYLKARDEGKLLKTQLKFAKACDLLMRGLAHVGIVALVDEATGYQEVRDRKALQVILDKYITDELAKWTKTFPDEYYKHLFRLKNTPYPLGEKGRKPSYVGHWTNDIVYDRLAPGVKEALKKKNPRDKATGSRKHKHHQHLTRDYGHPVLTEHLSNVTFLMASCTDWKDFKKRLDIAKPKFGKTIEMDV
ncbi:MAG TPA: hypothetical protein ENH34_06415 [Phycisphaerales bacterium]|nr:hypothetical protein [Phycisphaerales bacterium]